MALNEVFKSFTESLGEEVKQFKSIINRIRLTADSSAIGANYRKFGPSFGAYDFDVFLEKAGEFYKQAMADKNNPRYTIVEMPDNRIAIDFDGNIRGIFTRKGKPLAFFRPDYMKAGYASKVAELSDFRKGMNILFS